MVLSFVKNLDLIAILFKLIVRYQAKSEHPPADCNSVRL